MLGLISYGWWQIPGAVAFPVSATKDVSASLSHGSAVQAELAQPHTVTAEISLPAPLNASLARTELAATVRGTTPLQAVVVSRKALAARLECRS